MLRPFAIDHAPLPEDLPRGTRLAANSLYFDTLLSLIPPKYYLRPEGGDYGEEADSKYFKVSAIMRGGLDRLSAAACMKSAGDRYIAQ